jgi:hypothetical protein
MRSFIPPAEPKTFVVASRILLIVKIFVQFRPVVWGCVVLVTLRQYRFV